jgi:hypothetical protein
MLNNFLYYIKSRKNNRDLFIRDLKFLKQRIIRGWDDSETWSLDFTVAKFMLPRLIRFKELKCGYPCNLTKEEWDKILDEILIMVKEQQTLLRNIMNIQKTFVIVMKMLQDYLVNILEVYGGKCQIYQEKK